jgi:hypothetical protein
VPTVDRRRDRRRRKISDADLAHACCAGPSHSRSTVQSTCLCCRLESAPALEQSLRPRRPPKRRRIPVADGSLLLEHYLRAWRPPASAARPAESRHQPHGVGGVFSPHSALHVGVGRPHRPQQLRNRPATAERSTLRHEVIIYFACGGKRFADARVFRPVAGGTVSRDSRSGARARLPNSSTPRTPTLCV